MFNFRIIFQPGKRDLKIRRDLFHGIFNAVPRASSPVKSTFLMAAWTCSVFNAHTKIPHSTHERKIFYCSFLTFWQVFFCGGNSAWLYVFDCAILVAGTLILCVASVELPPQLCTRCTYHESRDYRERALECYCRYKHSRPYPRYQNYFRRARRK